MHEIIYRRLMSNAFGPRSVEVYGSAYHIAKRDDYTIAEVAKGMLNAITEAKTDIRVQAYLFSYAPIAQALADAQNRGIQVRIILDKNQKTSTHSSVNFFTAHHIPTKFDESFHTAHNKIIIVDDNTVITGSFNFIKTAEEKNAENVLIIRGNKKLADLYIKNWEWRWKNSVAVFPIDHT